MKNQSAEGDYVILSSAPEQLLIYQVHHFLSEREQNMLQVIREMEMKILEKAPEKLLVDLLIRFCQLKAILCRKAL